MIVVDLSPYPIKYEPEVLVYVGKSVQEFINMIEAYGGYGTLETNRCFAIMFNTEPDIDKIENYNILLDKYSKSDRVSGNQYWIGAAEEDKHSQLVKIYLDSLFGTPDWKCVTLLDYMK